MGKDKRILHQSSSTATADFATAHGAPSAAARQRISSFPTQPTSSLFHTSAFLHGIAATSDALVHVAATSSPIRSPVPATRKVTSPSSAAATPLSSSHRISSPLGSPILPASPFSSYKFTERLRESSTLQLPLERPSGLIRVLSICYPSPAFASASRVSSIHMQEWIRLATHSTTLFVHIWRSSTRIVPTRSQHFRSSLYCM